MTTTTTSTARLQYLINFFSVAIQHLPVPTRGEASFWLKYPDELVETAIQYAARKFPIGDDFPESENVARYITATCRGIERNRLRKLAMEVGR